MWKSNTQSRKITAIMPAAAMEYSIEGSQCHSGSKKQQHNAKKQT